MAKNYKLKIAEPEAVKPEKGMDAEKMTVTVAGSGAKDLEICKGKFKIEQIVVGGHGHDRVFGLGNDGKMYRWNTGQLEWTLWRAQPAVENQKTSSVANPDIQPQQVGCCTNKVLGDCGRGRKYGCNDNHCKCLNISGSCPNMHYSECKKHYIHSK